MQPSIIKVSQLNRYVKAMLDENKLLTDIMVKGELSSVSFRSQAGHYYFTLEEGGALLSCVMFSRYAEKLRSFPEEGSLVVLRGAVSLYEREGRFQLVAYDVQTIGQGKGAEDLAALRGRLLAEGLFDPERKKSLPPFPRAVAVITSGEGAALWDIVTAMERHNSGIPILIYPATVQGTRAVESLLASLQAVLSEGRADLIIMGRGGGASESLTVFNDERLLRAVAASSIPVISAVGHDVDYTLLDEAADARAATPTAAAAICGRSRAELLSEVELLSRRLYNYTEKRIFETSREFSRLERILELKSPENSLRRNGQRLSYLVKLMQESMEHRLWKENQRCINIEGRLSLLSPEAPLMRGYSISACPKGQPLRSVREISVGETFVTRLADGELLSEVRAIKPKEGNRNGQ